MRKPKNSLLSMALIGALSAIPASNAHAADLDWSATLYAWLPSISSDLANETPPVEGGSDTEFEDIIDKIDGVFMGHMEVQGDDFGALTDIIFLSLGDDKDFDRASTESDLNATVFELAGVWSPGEQRNQGFEVIGGLRHIILDVEVEFDPIDPAYSNRTVGTDESFSDLMVGARYIGSFNEKWGYNLRADGSWGDTEGTMNLVAGIDYKTKSGAWLLDYRYMTVELGDDDTDIELTLNGPVIGYTFKW